MQAGHPRKNVALLDRHLAEVALADAFRCSPQREYETRRQAFRVRGCDLRLLVGEHMADDAEAKVDELH
jgi:hypothetical protein